MKYQLLYHKSNTPSKIHLQSVGKITNFSQSSKLNWENPQKIRINKDPKINLVPLKENRAISSISTSNRMVSSAINNKFDVW